MEVGYFHAHFIGASHINAVFFSFHFVFFFSSLLLSSYCRVDSIRLGLGPASVSCQSHRALAVFSLSLSPSLLFKVSAFCLQPRITERRTNTDADTDAGHTQPHVLAYKHSAAQRSPPSNIQIFRISAKRQKMSFNIQIILLL